MAWLKEPFTSPNGTSATSKVLIMSRPVYLNIINIFKIDRLIDMGVLFR